MMSPKPSDLLPPAAADAAARVMRALSHPGRLSILCVLAAGERASGEIARRLGMSDAAASQQLARLRAAGLVTAHRDGQRICYRLGDPNVAALLETLWRLYCADDPPT